MSFFVHQCPHVGLFTSFSVVNKIENSRPATWIKCNKMPSSAAEYCTNSDLITDIEDLYHGDPEEISPKERFRNKKSNVVAKVKKTNRPRIAPEDSGGGDSFLPGQAKVYVKTWGCAHNRLVEFSIQNFVTN